MDGDSPSGWVLVRFTEQLERWIDRESPDQDTRLVVANWIMTRYSDPYQGVVREHPIPDLWFGRIPQTLNADDTVVVCAYFVFEQTKIFRCDNIGRIGLPL